MLMGMNYMHEHGMSVLIRSLEKTTWLEPKHTPKKKAHDWENIYEATCD